MSILRSKRNVAGIALAIGILVSLYRGPAAKVEAEEGYLFTALPSVIFVSGIVWLLSTVIRLLIGERDEKNA
ncbi:MAG TPA: hypothetical protein VJM34_00030 [Novosphingobium sp.]|nr:hypothetical protein [Novosphingobium sp.]